MSESLEDRVREEEQKLAEQRREAARQPQGGVEIPEGHDEEGATTEQAATQGSDTLNKLGEAAQIISGLTDDKEKEE